MALIRSRNLVGRFKSQNKRGRRTAATMKKMAAARARREADARASLQEWVANL
jgi:hypothetical protein